MNFITTLWSFVLQERLQPIRNVTDNKKNIDISERVGKWPHKVNSPNIKDFDRKDGGQRHPVHREIFPKIWQ